MICWFRGRHVRQGDSQTPWDTHPDLDYFLCWQIFIVSTFDVRGPQVLGGRWREEDQPSIVQFLELLPRAPLYLYKWYWRRACKGRVLGMGLNQYITHSPNGQGVFGATASVLKCCSLHGMCINIPRMNNTLFLMDLATEISKCDCHH